MIPSIFGKSFPTYSEMPTSVSIIRSVSPSRVGTGRPSNAWLGGRMLSSSSCVSSIFAGTEASVIATSWVVSSSTLALFGEGALFSASSSSLGRVADIVGARSRSRDGQRRERSPAACNLNYLMAAQPKERQSNLMAILIFAFHLHNVIQPGSSTYIRRTSSKTQQPSC